MVNYAYRISYSSVHKALTIAASLHSTEELDGWRPTASHPTGRVVGLIRALQRGRQ